MNNVSKSELYRLYITENKTMKQISDELGIATGKIHRLIHECGIPVKTPLDYPTTEKVRQTWIAIGKRGKGKKLSEEHKRKLSESKKLHTIGHRKKHVAGYILLYYPDYPSSTKDGYVMEHVYLMEQHLGRQLRDDEVVHHKNFNKSDNRIENLQVMTRGEHTSYHATLRHRQKRGDDLSIQ